MKLAVALLAFLAAPAIAQSLPHSAPIALDPRNAHDFLYDGHAMVLITSGEHYGSVMNEAFDYHTYLDTLQADGLNYTRLFGGSYVEVPGASFGIRRNTLAPASGQLLLPWARSSQPGYAGGGNKFDLSKWDSAYFKRLHDFLLDAERHDIIVEISLFSSQYDEPQWKMSPFNPANNVNYSQDIEWKKINTLNNGPALHDQERYVRELVRAVNLFPNVIFELQNEPWSDRPVTVSVVNPYLFPPARDHYPNSIEVADEASIQWQTRVAEWITSEESNLPNHHLIAQCYANFGLPVRTLIPGVSMINFHYAYPETVTWNYGLNKAIAYDETGFLGPGDDVYRRQAWNFMLSGGSAFDGLDYSFSVGHENGDDTAPNGPGGGSPTLRKQLGILHRFLAALPLTQMTPDTRWIVHAEGVVPHAMADRSGIYAAYLDGKGPSRVTVALPKGRYVMEWLDPVSGKFTPEPQVVSNGSPLSFLSPEFDNGIALSLTRVSPQKMRPAPALH